jgi:hypothetical protein
MTREDDHNDPRRSEAEATRALLARTLDAFGADRSRWPRGRAAELAGIAGTEAGAGDEAARRLVQEAEALDGLLAAATGADGHGRARPGQVDAILAAALARRPPATEPPATEPPATEIFRSAEEAEPIDLAARRRARAPATNGRARPASPTVVGPARATGTRYGTPATWGRAATLLAASLMLGVFVGASDLGTSTLLELGAALGVEASSESTLVVADTDGLEDLL